MFAQREIGINLEAGLSIYGKFRDGWICSTVFLTRGWKRPSFSSSLINFHTGPWEVVRMGAFSVDVWNRNL